MKLVFPVINGTHKKIRRRERPRRGFYEEEVSYFGLGCPDVGHRTCDGKLQSRM